MHPGSRSSSPKISSRSQSPSAIELSMVEEFTQQIEQWFARLKTQTLCTTRPPRISSRSRRTKI